MFSKKDVITVAEAMVDPEHYASYDDYGGGRYECIYCDRDHWKKPSLIKHATNCPVLIAQDLLTGE